jgi:hypothetical protein
MGGAMKQDAVVFIDSKEMGNGLLDFGVRQICCDIFSEIPLEGQVIKELPQCPDPCLFHMNGWRLVISDEGGKMGICDGPDSGKAL